MILEYKLDAGPNGMVTPPWVENGGYFQDPDNFTMVGVSPAVHEYKIPDSVTTLTEAELEARVLSIHSRHPMTDPENNTMTDAQVSEMVSAWCAANA
ncbi:hypothetical protein N9060_01315 [Arenicella sp.]|nr:hypothetical protein [Arenicella sp.]